MHRDATAVVGDHLTYAAAEPLGRESATRHLDVAVDDHGLAVRGPHGHEAAAGQADHAGFGHHGDECGGQRCVDGVATLVGNGQSGLEGLLSRGRYGDLLTSHSAHDAGAGRRQRLRPTGEAGAEDDLPVRTVAAWGC